MSGAVIELLPTGTPLFTVRTSLDGREYELRIDYVGRLDRFTLDISTGEGDELAKGIRLISNWPLLRRRQHEPRLPPGELFIVDGSGIGDPAGLDQLGDPFQLIYYTAAELGRE